MNNLKDIVAFVLKHYPHKDELSNARVTKMVYLADWHQAINYDCQITKIEWYFDNFGPFVSDVQKTIEANPELFEYQECFNSRGNSKKLFSLKKMSFEPSISENAIKSLKHVIEATNEMTWGRFIKLVYSTHPISSSVRYSDLNLVLKAREYKAAAK